MVNWTGELIWPKNKLLAVYFFTWFCWPIFGLGQSPRLVCCAAKSCADLWMRINPGDRESGAKVLLAKQCPEGAVRQYS